MQKEGLSADYDVEARRQWIEDLKSAAISLGQVKDATTVGEDFLYSMHRPIFHAAAWGDASLPQHLDFYFGRDGFNDPRAEHISRARKAVLANATGSSPWISLLDFAYRKDDRKILSEFDEFVSKVKPANREIRRAIIEVGHRLGRDRETLEHQLAAARLPDEMPNTEVHMSYTTQILIPFG